MYRLHYSNHFNREIYLKLMAIELTSRDFRDYLLNSVNSRDRQIMAAEAEPLGDLGVTLYRLRSADFVNVTPVYTSGTRTIDLLVESGTVGLYGRDFGAFLESIVNNDQIFSPGNPLAEFDTGKIEAWRIMLKRIANPGEGKMTCLVQNDVNTRGDYHNLMDAFMSYMGMPVLFYLYRMGEFVRKSSLS
jgi:hypothetical protein